MTVMTRRASAQHPAPGAGAQAGGGQGMRLYSSANSPFGARVDIAARVKGVELPVVPLPAGGLRSPAFLKINPLARIPVLICENGAILPESEPILRYIEARFPEPSLCPDEAEARARMDVIIRVLDLYVCAPIIALFPELNPARRNPDTVAREVARWHDGLTTLAHVAQGTPPTAPAGLTLADCALVPSLHLGTRIAAMLDLPADPLLHQPGLVARYRELAAHPVVGPALEALTAAQEARDLRAGLPSLAHRHRAMAGHG